MLTKLYHFGKSSRDVLSVWAALLTVKVVKSITGLIFYLTSFAGSLAKTRLAKARLYALPGSSTTIVTISAISRGGVQVNMFELDFPL